LSIEDKVVREGAGISIGERKVKVPVQKSRKAAMAESETCEFKKSLAELKDGLVSIAAILNKHGVNCIQIVFSGKDTPYWAHGRAYMRVADEDRQMSAKELEKFILEKAPQAEFEDVAGIFIARFSRPLIPAQDAPVKSSVKSSVKTPDRIIAMVAETSGISIAELSGHLHLTTRAVEKQMAKLQREGRLRRIGPDKGGHWEVMP
jgi:ATP-dependent DNA helicase RecG